MTEGSDMKRTISRAAWSISPVVLAVSVVGLGESVDGGPRAGGSPDTYIAAWDSVGVQANSSAETGHGLWRRLS